MALQQLRNISRLHGGDGDGDAPRVSPFDDGDEEDDVDMTALDDAPRFEACGLVTRMEEKEELGDPGRRSTCFGCVYIGEREQTAIPYKDIMDLIEMGRAAVGRCDPITLATDMALRYKAIRRKCNQNLMAGEQPLPQWKAATILEHIRMHNQDPETQMWITLCEIQELKQAALEGAVEMNQSTKRKRVNEKQVAAYEKLVKLQWYVQGKDPQKMWGYSGGSHIDPKSINQGMMALSGKNIVSLWENASNNARY